ncbi:MAG: hypothetical protein LQ338_005064 [Usnochroma carphineum]|nr:MAG: hypothetical protein LQ338_005064 [Usnochroma carphineum]
MGRTSVSGSAGNGKPKARKPAKKNSKAEFYCDDANSESSDSNKTNTQQLPDSGLNSFGLDFDYAASQPWNDANFMSDLCGSPNFASFSDLQANASDLAQSQSATSQSEANLPSSDQLNFAGAFQNNSNNPIPSPNCIRVGVGPSALEYLSPDLLTVSNTISDQASSVAHQSTSCDELAASTLRSLALPSSICNSSSHPILLHTVEQVLATSHGAISTFNSILQCPCSRSSSFTLILALMISKILDCYSAICRCSTSSPTSSHPLPISSPAAATTSGIKGALSAGDLPTPSSPSNPLTTLSPTSSCSSSSIPRSAPQNIVLDTPIAIAGYTVEPDDEHAIILQLVLSELRKVGKLVDVFAAQCSPVNPNTCGGGLAAGKAIDGRSDGGEDSVSKSLEQFLRCQLHAARKEVDTVLRRREEVA